ncbi:unnamed protein product [Bursaphelenchus okinawaensis]|uniref:Tudor domain-containing protein n=1 Tax=Bursaphelenchus okinawaensis TaxID=465554 RepID=A0A811JSW8_9BILA|nr:unnamed protein product [Bursaphelenchus okinawaensis]CAG9081762.1 unnamed protein product [Bursaphelenchus okinawaensis]
MSADLENLRIQLQHVEAALLAAPDNKELLELKANVQEIIRLQEEILQGEEEVEPEEPNTSVGPSKNKEIKWNVGDRCLAPSKNGQRYLAVIDGISQNNVAVTFASNGVKVMVRLQDLKVAPQEDRKNYLFQNKGKVNTGPSKEWHAEKERRKIRAQKKEQRKKQLDEAGEKQKNKWLNFNSKALNKNFKGIKKVEQSRSAPDGPRSAAGARNTTQVSSRTVNNFGATSRGNMDSLF